MELPVNVKKIKDRIFFSIPVKFWSGSVDTLKGQLINDTLIIPFHDYVLGVSDEEMLLLKKINKLRYDQRKVMIVDATLSQKEKDIIQGLITKGLVTLYAKGKYAQDPTYILSDVVAFILKNSDSGVPSNIESKSSTVPEKEIPKEKEIPNYLILESKGEASQISSKYAVEIKAGKMFGVRDMKDKNFYVLSSKFYNEIFPQIIKILADSPKNIEEISDKLVFNDYKINDTEKPEVGKALVFLMREKGEIYFNNGRYVIA